MTSWTGGGLLDWPGVQMGRSGRTSVPQEAPLRAPPRSIPLVSRFSSHSTLLVSASSLPLSSPPKTLPKQRGGEKRPPTGDSVPWLYSSAAMGIEKYKQWGVAVRPGETVKCDPGELYCYVSQVALQAGKGNEDVRVFVKVDGKEILIGTLSVDKYPQCTIGLVFDKEFELLHTSRTSTISALGYRFIECKRKSDPDTRTEEDDESDEEVPLAIPLYPNADDDKSKETNRGAEKPAATESSKQKIRLEETKDPRKLKADLGGTDNDDSNEEYVDSEDGESGDDEDSNDEDDSKSSDEDDEDSPNNTECKNRPAETPLKTAPEKKARIATPSDKIGTAKKSGYVHVATPYPSSKHVKKTPSFIDSSMQSTGYACKSCSKTFHSSVGLETHCKVKHSARK